MAITVQMRTDVSQLYVALFGRAPDSEGLGFWVQALNSGTSLTAVADSMYATAPARAYFPTYMTNQEVVASFYVNVLGRPADTEGLAFWTAALNGSTKGAVISQMVANVTNWTPSGNAVLDAAGQLSKNLYVNKVAVAQYYGEHNGTIAGATAILSGVTADVATVAAAKAAVDGAVVAGQTFTLTAGVDAWTGTAGNDTVNALAANLNAFDSISAGAGTDTLNIDDTATGALANFAGATVTGFETLVINSKLGLLGAALNTATTLPGLTSLKVGMASAAATEVITAATTTALDITNTTAKNITVVGGGNTASVVTAGAGNVLVGQATTPASTDANKFTSVSAKTGAGTVDITDNSGAAGVVGNTLTSVAVTGTVGATTGTSTLTGKGLTSVTLKDTSGAVNIANATVGGHALNLNVAGVTAGTITDSTATSAIVTANATTAAGTGSTFTLAGDAITGLTVGGTKSVALTSTLAKVATVTVTGSGGLTTDLSGDGAGTTLGYVTSVDTTGSTAVLSAANGTTANVITIGNSTSFAGGAGTDNVSTGASTKALSLGAGNDKLTLSALLATGATANGGDGVDTLALTSTLAATVASSVFNAQLSNFERLEITSAAPTGGVPGTPVNQVQTIELGFLSNVNSYVKYNGILGATDNTNAQTLNNLANNGTVELAGDITATVASLTVNVANAAFGLTDSVNLVLSTTTDAVRAAGAVTVAAVETVNIATSNTATTPTAQLDTISLTAAAAKTITVSGNAGLDMSAVATGTLVTSINASGITLGDFKVTTGALAAAATIVGTAQGSNTIDATLATKAVNISIGGGKVDVSNILKGGAAADIIVGGAGNDTITSGGGLDSLTGGGGKDTFIIADGSGTATNRVVLTDYVRTASSGSSDLLDFTGTAAASAIAVAGFTVTNGVYVKAGASVADFYAGLAGGAALSVAAFEAAGNTYVLYTGATTATTDDVFVELTGVTGLTSVSTTAGANALFIA